MKTMEQRRSEFALKKIETRFNGKVDEETARFFVGMPTMILTNGIGQTLAFLLSKNSKESKKPMNQYLAAFEILKDWLIDSGKVTAGSGKTNLDFLKSLTEDMQKYLDAQNEALAIMNWMKRYARAFEG